MKQLDRYLLHEVAAPFAAGTLVFVAVILVNTIVANTAAIFALHPSTLTVLKWLALRIPIILTIALPVGCMLATSLVVIRLGRDQEITALRMGGVSVRRIFAPLYLAGLTVSVLAVANNELVAPGFRLRANQVLLDRILQSPGSTVKTDLPFRAGESDVVHVGRVDLKQQQMYFVLIYRFREGRPVEALCARQCVKQGRQWVLQDGLHHRFDDEGHLVSSEPFTEQPVHFAESLAELWSDETEPEQMSARELARRAALSRQAGDVLTNIQMRYYLHTKFALPLTCLIFTLLAAPLSLRLAHKQTHSLAGVMLTIAVVFFCNGTINYAKAIALSGPQAFLPPVFAAWLHVLVFGGLAGLLTWRAEA